jgi:uncharacterized SAM-binding protein YcdF (DUF218 family)
MSYSYLEPALPLFLLIALLSLIRLWRRCTKGNKPWLLAVSILGLFLLSWDPFSWLLSQPLEMGYDRNPLPHSAAEAIVVLAGSVNSPNLNRPYAWAGADTRIRFEHAVWLFRQWMPLPILACGGGTDPGSYSKTMRHLLESEGIPSDSIWIESRSRNTYENALYGAEILRQHGISRIALVIDAASMLRAAACFRKQGITVVPAPFAFQDVALSLDHILPSWRAIQSNGENIHELIGLLWYRLHGRI